MEVERREIQGQEELGSAASSLPSSPPAQVEVGRESRCVVIARVRSKERVRTDQQQQVIERRIVKQTEGRLSIGIEERLRSEISEGQGVSIKDERGGERKGQVVPETSVVRMVGRARNGKGQVVPETGVVREIGHAQRGKGQVVPETRAAVSREEWELIAREAEEVMGMEVVEDDLGKIRRKGQVVPETKILKVGASEREKAEWLSFPVALVHLPARAGVELTWERAQWATHVWVCGSGAKVALVDNRWQRDDRTSLRRRVPVSGGKKQHSRLVREPVSFVVPTAKCRLKWSGIEKLAAKALMQGTISAQNLEWMKSMVLSGQETGYRGEGFMERDYSAKKRKDEQGKKEEGVRWSKMMERVQQGRAAGPFARPPYPNTDCRHHAIVGKQCSIPKNKWDKESEAIRVISNKSSPKGLSVNDLTPRSDGGISYHTFGDFLQEVVRMGKGCWLVLADVVDAYKVFGTRVEDLWQQVQKVVWC